MAGYKLKRKGVDQVSDDFSDFSLSSPATKIRRLDAELPPIVEVGAEEEELVSPSPIEAEAEAEAPNEERALVLFKPLLHSSPSSSFSLSLRSDLFSGIKDQRPWSKQYDSDCERLVRSSALEEDKSNHRLALVPWVPSSSSSQLAAAHGSNNINTELMDADEMGGGGGGEAEESMMDIEQQGGTTSSDSSTSTIHYPATLNLHGIGGNGITAPEGFHQFQQQQQQHCLLPQLPQNTSTPITWTR